MVMATRRVILGILGLATAVGLAVSQVPPVPDKPAEPDTTTDDQNALRAVGVAPDGPALLDYFRKRTLPTADPKKIATLIRQLGDDDFTTRETANANLAALGGAATAALLQADKDNAPTAPHADAEVRKRIEALKGRIEAKAEPAVQAAAARLIARARPAGAADVLFAYLPFAVDASVVDEVCKTLGAVAVVDGKVEPVVLKALDDATPLKRGAAGEAIVRAGVKDQMDAARALLKDADAQVRLRVALALVPRRDKSAVPALIDLLAELSPEQLWPAENVLVRLAGDKAPPVSLGTNEPTRKAARDAWQKWYTEHKDRIDLAKLDGPETMLGYTTIVQQRINQQVVGKFQPPTFEVLEIKADKSVRWKFDMPNNQQAVDVQVLGENRVLIAEYQTQRVSERDFKGKVLWEKNVGGNPIGVQRLPNGNTFVVKINGLSEYDRAGKEVFTYHLVQNQFGQNIFRGRKLRNGEMVFISNTGVFTRMDKNKKVLKTFNVRPIQSLFGNMDVLPDGGIVVADLSGQRVVEYNADGKEVKSLQVQWPLGAVRLPNGNTLVTTQNPPRVLELNRKGQEVWAYQIQGNIFNARRR